MTTKRQLKKFAEFVAKEVISGSVEEYPEAFAEVACRKLHKLGIVGKDDDNWTYDVEDGDGDG
jgi:hypothetical protein